jgi:aminomethyltransferase
MEFAGFEMPVYYSSIVEEHLAVRNSVGLFDVSHMGEIFIKGKNALDFVQKITINDASKLEFGKVQYSAMCYESGGIVDDLLVYKLDDGFMLVVNASNIDKDLKWIKSNQIEDVEVNDLSDDYSLLAVQGPNSAKVLSSLVDFKIYDLKYYTFELGQLIGIDVLISRTGYTGELGFEIYFKGDKNTASKIWNAVIESGKSFGIKPSGLGARNSLRLEMGYCLYGNDIDQSTNPLEAGLGWITKFNKGSFIGRSELMKAESKGLKRSLLGFELSEKGIARQGSEIYYNREKIGYVTSGIHSPFLNKSIGLGYFARDKIESRSIFEIDIRGKRLKAKLTNVPFIKK